MSYGFTGKVLWVSLTKAEFREEPTEKWSEWIGGRGLGSYLLSQSPDLNIDDPAVQTIVISAGPLVGSGVPLGTRTSVSARNQLSKGFCYSNVGGGFGIRMKMAGYDTIVVEGASVQPIYLLLQESGVKFIPAEELWGLQISALQDALFRKHGDRHLDFIGIGPAGEREAAISCLMVGQGHAAAWGGSGAVFGAKKLKAIAAIGDKPISIFNPEGLKNKARQLEWRINASEAMAGLVRGGTHAVAGAGGYSGLVPTGVKNLQDEYLSPEELAPIREDAFKRWEIARVGCTDCIINCMHAYVIESEKYGKIVSEGIHANSVRGLGPNLGVVNPEDLLMLHKLCNEYGLDVDGVSSAVAFALECAEHGILDREQPGDVQLEWGNGPALVKLIRHIGEGAGLGEILSKGVHKASRQIGKGSERYAINIKGVGINEQGLRSHRAWALGISTSSRGGGHLGGSPQTENQRMSPELGERLFENRFAGVPESYNGKGKLVAWTEGNKAIVDSLGLCYFVYGESDLSLGCPDELAELLFLATGIKQSGEEFHQLGIRIHTLERYMTHRLGGYTRRDDILPDRFFDTVVSNGLYQGAHLEREQVELALDEYFATLGWDVATGVPTPETLIRMGLAFLLQSN
jgi:aldehyde:ferredoxin oxidoreductase